MTIRKAIILAAGKGTRLRPLTLAVPKEMIRVGKKPVIEHVINVLGKGGVEEILVIVGRKKNAIMNYLESGERWGLNIYYRIQEEPRGTADAISLGEDFFEQENFVVMYGDNYFKPYDGMVEIVKFHNKKNSSGTIVTHLVEDPTRFGIVDTNVNRKVLDIVEKPSWEEARPYEVDGKYQGSTGLMILNSEVFDFIERTKPGKNDEVWLTDSIKLMIEKNRSFYACSFEGTRFDIGTFDSLEKADRLEQENFE